MVFTCNKCGIAHMYKDSWDHCEHWGRFRTDGKKVSLQQAVDKMFIFNLNRVPGLGIRSIADILPDVFMKVILPPTVSVSPDFKMTVGRAEDLYKLSTYEKDGKTYLRVED